LDKPQGSGKKMKKTKNDFREYEKQLYYQTASRLLENKDYPKEWEKLNKAKQVTNQFFSFPKGESPAEIENKIRKKYSVAQAYDPDFLRKVKKGEKALLAEIVDIVDPRIDDGNHENEYIYLKIKLNAPKNMIHYLIDTTIDIRLRVYKESGIDILGKKKRFRKERSDAMKVWEEREIRKPFKQIAKEQNISVPTAKKRFYRAYELINGMKFSRSNYEQSEIVKPEECPSCPKYSACLNPDTCPKVSPYLKSSTKYQREKPVKDIEKFSSKRYKPRAKFTGHSDY
jgi:hypothetical protein